MIRSKSTHILRRKSNASRTYSSFLKSVNETNKNKCCSSVEISTYYDAIPYLKYCREGSSIIRDTDGPLKLIFDLFAEAVEPVKQLNNNKLSFTQIQEANTTICLTELLMFCDFWTITKKAFISKAEISALLRIVLNNYPNLHQCLDENSFADLLCHLAVVVYSRPPLQSKEIDTNYKKIQSFIQKFKLHDMQFVKQRLFIPKNYGFSVIFNRKLLLKKIAIPKMTRRNTPKTCSSTVDKSSNIRKKGRVSGRNSITSIISMNSILDINEKEDYQHFDFGESSQSVTIRKRPETATGLWNTETTKQLKSLNYNDFHLTRKLLRSHVTADWRKYHSAQFDMKCLRFSHYDLRYKYKLCILNRSTQHIRIEIGCDSRLFIIQYDGNYISQGMQNIVYIQTIAKYKIMKEFKNNAECKSFITCKGINRKGKIMWKTQIPIYYKIVKTSPNDERQQVLFRSFGYLPKCVTPLSL